MAKQSKPINWELVEKMIEAGCSAKEIYPKFYINEDTFYRRFKSEFGIAWKDYHGDLYSKGNGDLRIMLHAKAMNNSHPGNTTLLMFLGRTRLGLVEPDTAPTIAANQPQIDQSHRIMELENKIAELEAKNGMDQT